MTSIIIIFSGKRRSHVDWQAKHNMKLEFDNPKKDNPVYVLKRNYNLCI